MRSRRTRLALPLVSLSLVAQAPYDKPDLRLEFEKKRQGRPVTASLLDRKARLAEREAAIERSRRDAFAPSREAGLEAAAAPALMQWVNLGPQTARWGGNAEGQNYVSGRIRTVLPHPTNANILYVATAGGGVFKCGNAALASTSAWTWMPLTDTLPTATADGSISVGALAMSPTDPETLFLAMGDPHGLGARGFYTSHDGGASWVRGGALGEALSAFEILPLDDQTLLVASPSGLFRSADGGKTFASLMAEHFTSVKKLGASLVASSDGKIYTSADRGRTWQAATIAPNGLANGLARLTLATSPASATVAYAMGSDGSNGLLSGVLKTTDGGRTWAFVNATNGLYLGGQGWYNQLLAVDPDDANRLVIAGTGSTYRSLDGGLTWTSLNASANYTHPDFHTATWSKTGPKALYLGHDGGLSVLRDPYRDPLPTDVDPTFLDHRRNQGLVSFLVYHVGSTLAPYPADARHRISLGLQDNGTMLRQGNPTDLAGSTVFQDRVGGDGLGTLIHPLDGSRVLASYQEGPIQRSLDGGLSWGNPVTGLVGSGYWYTPVIAGLGDPTGDTVYTLRSSGVHKSTDFGATFTLLPSTGMEVGYSPWILASSKARADVLAVSDGSSIYVSQNGGGSWTKAAVPPASIAFSSLWFDTSNAQILYVGSTATGDGNKLWKSADQGRTWKALDGGATASNGFPYGAPVHAVQNDPTAPATLYAATDLGLYRSTNGGANWARLGTGFPIVAVRDFYLAPDGSFLRAATWGRGLWEIQLKQGNTVTTSVALPATDLVVDHRQSITFKGTATSSATGATFTYLWDFADGTKATGQQVTKSFTNQGGANLVYAVRVTALDGTGAAGVGLRTITVKPGPDETAPVVSSVWAYGRSGLVQLQAEVTDNVAATKVEFFVDGVKRGDGVLQAGSPVWKLDLDSKQLANGPHRFSVKATDAARNSTSAPSPASLFINNSFEMAFVSPGGTWGKPLVMTAGEAKDFVGTATPLTAGTALTARWTFGDGATAAGTTANHAYAIEGGYRALFTVTDPSGFSETAWRNIPVVAPPEKTFAEVEPNNTAASANAVAATYNVLTGSLPLAADKDHFAYTLQAGQEKAFRLSGPKEANFNLYLLASTGTVLAKSENAGSEEAVNYKNAATAAKTVYVRVESAQGGSTTPYRVEIANPAPVDAIPPDVAAVTYSGTKGKVVLGAPASDDQGIRSIEYFVDGRSVGVSTVDPFSLTWDSATVSNGTHLLQAKAKDTSGNAGEGPVTDIEIANPLSLAFQEAEPNNTYGSANVVPDGIGEIGGKIGSGSDQDHFKLVLAPGASLRVAMTGPGDKDYDLYLLSGAGAVLVRSEHPGSAESIAYTNTLATPRTVILQVKGYAGATSAVPYKLMLTR